MMYFKEESLQKAFNILNEIAENIKKIDELKEKKNKIQISEAELSNQTSQFNKALEEMKDCNKKILNLSNQYYELIPFTKPINEFISPINIKKISPPTHFGHFLPLLNGLKIV